MKILILVAMLAVATGCVAARAGESTPGPNILLILADDLGYGDVHCFNPSAGLIKTPNLDRLAAQGMLFTDAHSGSAVCTPTRYGLLTGRYAWRTRLQSGVLGGFSPPLIAPDRLTLPALLGKNGYSTACVGKWHLGLTWPRSARGSFGDDIQAGRENASELSTVNWKAAIQNGPAALGFDEFFGISASLDMPPFVFIRGDLVTEIPTVQKQFVRRGPAAVSFEARDVLPARVKETLVQIKTRAVEARNGRPFFYLPRPNLPAYARGSR